MWPYCPAAVHRRCTAKVATQENGAAEHVPQGVSPSSPLQALRALLPASQIEFNSGEDLAAATALAQSADITLVFATQWASEAYDLESLNLPDGQNELITALAKANAKP